MATSIFPHPSSNDSADKLNYKWMLMLMLLVSVVSFIIPLHPFYNSGNNQEATSPSFPGPFIVQDLKPATIPIFKAVCWTPSSMTGPQVVYASAYCTNEYNAAIRGQPDRSVYQLSIDRPIPIDSKGEGVTIKPMTPDSDSTEEDNNKQYIGPDPQIIAVNKFKERVRKLVAFQAPITLLMMAVCLGLSQVVWSFLSECCGSFNVGETLELVGRQSESRASEDISESLGQYFTRSGHSTGLIYLVKKFLSLVFVLGLLIFTVTHALPEVDGLHDEFSKLSSTLISSSAGNATNINTNMDEPPQNKADVFLCDFNIRQLQTLQSYTLQCIPSIDNDNTMEDPSPSPSSNSNAAPPSSTNPSSTVKTLLDFESLMLQIAVAILVVLFVNNLFSLCAWLVTLMSGSTKARIGLHDTASMDLVFLAQMSRINAGGQVAHIIARSSSGTKI